MEGLVLEESEAQGLLDGSTCLRNSRGIGMPPKQGSFSVE